MTSMSLTKYFLSHLQCSGDRPTCQRCASRGLICQYSEREGRSRGVSKTRRRNTWKSSFAVQDSSGVSPMRRVLSHSQPTSPAHLPLFSAADESSFVALNPQVQAQDQMPRSRSLGSRDVRRSISMVELYPELAAHLFDPPRTVFSMFDPYTQVPFHNMIGFHQGWDRLSEHSSRYVVSLCVNYHRV